MFSRILSIFIIMGFYTSWSMDFRGSFSQHDDPPIQSYPDLNDIAIELIRQLPPECQSNAGFSDQESRSISVVESHNDHWMGIMIGISHKLYQLANIPRRTLSLNLEELELDYIADCFHQYYTLIKENDTSKRITLFIPLNFSDVQDLIDPISFIFANLNSLTLKNCAPEVIASRFRSYVYGDQKQLPLLTAVQREINNMIKKYKQETTYPYIKHLEDIIDPKKLTIFQSEVAKMIPQEKAALQEFSNQISNYTTFVQENLIPYASRTNGLPKPVYDALLAINGVRKGISRIRATNEPKCHRVPRAIIPAEFNLCDLLISQGKADFELLYPQYINLANEIAATKNDSRRYPQNNPGLVIRNLMEDSTLKSQEEIISMYNEVQEELEDWIREDDFITLPDRHLRMRLGTPAEEASFPIPHVNTPSFINNKGKNDKDWPEFVLCNAIGNASPMGAYALSAHEGRPGHDLQFSTMVTKTLEGKMNLLESVLSSNSTNTEGWAHWVEYWMAKHFTSQAKLAALQDQLMRVCRLFLDPQINMGLISHEEVVTFYTEKLGLDDVTAKSEADRYSFLLPGQAVTYRFGALKISALYEELEEKLRNRFSTRRFNDALLSFGLLPLDLVAQFIEKRL